MSRKEEDTVVPARRELLVQGANEQTIPRPSKKCGTRRRGPSSRQRGQGCPWFPGKVRAQGQVGPLRGHS